MVQLPEFITSALDKREWPRTHFNDLVPLHLLDMTPGSPDFLHWSAGDAKISTPVENRKPIFQTEGHHFNVW